MTKEEIRRLYREKRTQLSNEELQKRQNDLEYQYTLFDLSPYQTVHVFLSIQKHNEPNTQPLIDLLFSQEKTVVVSKTDFATKHMTHWVITPKTPREVTSFWHFRANGWNTAVARKIGFGFCATIEL